MIVWTALLAVVCLRARFKQVHVVGCLLIVLSVLVGVATKLQADDCLLCHGDDLTGRPCWTGRSPECSSTAQ